MLVLERDLRSPTPECSRRSASLYTPRPLIGIACFSYKKKKQYVSIFSSSDPLLNLYFSISTHPAFQLKTSSLSHFCKFELSYLPMSFIKMPANRIVCFVSSVWGVEACGKSPCLCAFWLLRGQLQHRDRSRFTYLFECPIVQYYIDSVISQRSWHFVKYTFFQILKQNFLLHHRKHVHHQLFVSLLHLT